jgi:hypothetical protein
MTSDFSGRTGMSEPVIKEEFREPGHRARVVSNNSYNLAMELSELLTGVWRIDQYLKDSGEVGCDPCGQMWQDIRKQKEILIEKVREELVRHAKEGTFT